MENTKPIIIGNADIVQKMTRFHNTRILSLKYAFSGLGHVIKTQKNTCIYLIISVLVIAAAFLFRIEWHEWLLLLSSIGLVWSAECFNTAVEAVVDLATLEEHPIAKIAKDTAAAGVLVLAISAAIIGILIFGKYALRLLFASGVWR